MDCHRKNYLTLSEILQGNIGRIQIELSEHIFVFLMNI